MKNKIFICGKNLLPRVKRKALKTHLRAKKMKSVSKLEDAGVVIVVLGSNCDQESIAKIRELGKPFFPMNPNELGQGDYTFNLMNGIATHPSQAAQWAWSILNEPEKWTNVNTKPKNETT